VRAPDSLQLRRLALAVSVLDDIDMVPLDDGLLLTGDVPVEVGWFEVRKALAGAKPESDDRDESASARTRLSAWLRGRRIAADTDPHELRARARPVGLPVDHALHPGPDWVRQRVLGDTVDLGVGFVGVGPDPDEVVVVPQGALAAAGIDPAPWWPAAKEYLERMGALAAGRLSGNPGNPLLRPFGDCDVVTLVCAKTLRAALCAEDGTGMRTAAVPMRRRGWLDLSRIDPAFTIAAAAATAPAERGFSRPLLLTVDEVTLAPRGGKPADLVLRDPASAAPALRSVLYR